jgi:hypothetical protein
MQRGQAPARVKEPLAPRIQREIERQARVDRLLYDQSPIIHQLLRTRPGQKLLIEVEPLAQSDNTCVAGNLTVKDGPNKKVFSDLLFKINGVTEYNP